MQTLEATGDIWKVALWLGHNSFQSTEIYVRVDPAEKVEMIKGLVPPKLKGGRFRAQDSLLAGTKASPSLCKVKSGKRYSLMVI